MLALLISPLLPFLALHHGREPKERKERARQRSLREAAMWRSHKGKGLLGIAEAEKFFFYPSFARHKERESPAAAADAWLSTCRPALVLRKVRAMERVQAGRKHKKPSRARGIGEGCSSAGSAGDEEPAEAMLAGPGAGLHGITESC